MTDWIHMRAGAQGAPRAHQAWQCRALASAVLCTALAGCQAYRPLALDAHPQAQPDLREVRVDPARLDIPTLRNYPFNPADGLDITEVAMLAVVQNPDLKLARQDLHIAQAQAFSAGLLPDPQVNLSGDYPKDSGSGLTPAYNRGLSFDFGSLVQRPAQQRAAQAAARRTELTNLWQEWQVVAQARQLFIRTLSLEKTRQVLQEAFNAQDNRLVLAAHAVAQGNLTQDAAAPYLTAREDIRKQLSDVQRQQEQTRHDLNALLGMDPGTHLDLAGDITLHEPGPSELRAALDNIARRRPDLLALEAGYQSQDQKYRAAILGQFPSLTIGFNQARDTSGNLTLGYTASISLPVLNRNRGNIAIESATRERLHDEYSVRILQARADVDRLRADARLARRQLQEAERTLPLLRETVRSAEAAMQAGRITLFNYVDLQNSLLTKEVEMINLREAILEQAVGLMSLLGADEFSQNTLATEAAR